MCLSVFRLSVFHLEVWSEKKCFSILQEAGPVLITVYTEAGRKLGITFFLYVDGIIRSNSDVTQTLGLFSLPDQGM